jgi:predicted ester cyclase
MSTEEVKTLGRRVVEEVINGRKLEALDELIADNYVEHTRVPEGWPEGREALRQAIAAILDAFPDFHYTIEDELGEGDKVVHRLTATGTQTGEFLGMPATGKRASWSEMHIGRVEGGKFVEHWANVDQLGMMQQLGLIPQPEQTRV